MNTPIKKQLKKRFDGYLPVVIDIETTGVESGKHGLLEIAAVQVDYDDAGKLMPHNTDHWHVTPFEGAARDPKALAINGIDPDHPFRFAIPEKQALEELFAFTHEQLKHTGCRRALLVGHNAHFDLGFIHASTERCKLKDSPFHKFTCIDTATLAGVFYEKTVLSKALKAAKIDFDPEAAHSALYDAERTAELFCEVINLRDAFARGNDSPTCTSLTE